ncbi:MAG: Rrf2 family transcriptional regulator [Planctomycetes bacterium]|nr:Rrf2 family transcriptional regulator [Planctomycetota bacterium]MCD7897200.1 Rrf2 family transcriptional regulator [Planctomycetaceae bacterium]
MRINTQFPVAVHILAAIAYFKDGAIPSDMIAASIGTNPVVVRRLTARLKKKGLVDTRAGVKGASLRKAPKDITLYEVWDAVRDKDDAVFDLHLPNPDCPVGEHFAEALAKPLANAQKAMEKELASVTLQDVLKTIARRNRH